MKTLSDCTLLIGSGKGGVGKSTVCVNTAIAMAKKGLQVGVLDADVYGPSIPIMMGLRRMSPRTMLIDGQEVVVPFSKFGIKVMSIGFFVEEAQSSLWRGPVLHTALQKMIMSVDWGHLDVLLIDLPPGTGDVPLSLSQLLKVDGAIVVTTPQEVAAVDVIKAINCFHQLKIPLIGIIENMSGFTVDGVTHNIFGRGKADDLAERFESRVLGKIPLHPAICTGGDEGFPSACHQGTDAIGNYFNDIGSEIWSNLMRH